MPAIATDSHAAAPAAGGAAGAVLRIERLQVALPARGDRPFAVDDVSLEIVAGRTLCIVGESGSGKSVLATTVMGLLARALKPQQGRVVLGDRTVLDHGRYLPDDEMRALRGVKMGMVFQEPMTALNPVMTCGTQVEELLRAHTRWPADERRRRVLSVFEQVRLPEPQRMYASYPHQLSGGQRQRIVIAMAMILKPQLLICDEPTTALDVTTQAEILKLIEELQAQHGSAVLFITHDMGVVAQIADDVLVMREGHAVEHGPRDVVLRRPRAEYTRVLLDAVPSMTPPAPRPERAALASAPPVLSGERVGKTYVRRDWLGRSHATHALAEASVAVRPGETVGIVGESGSGKSTLARCLVRLIDPDAGVIHWGDAKVCTLSERRLRPLRSRVQVVFQDPNRSLNPRRRIGASLIEGAVNFGARASEAERVTHELMDRVRLPHASLSRYPHEFSGGQRQRLAIARALACQPQVLIADEAVSALDVSVQAQILKLLREIQADLSLAILFITHDLRVAAQLCDRVLVMHQGRIVEQGATADVFGRPQHEYTRRLLAAAPSVDFLRERAE